MGKVDGDKNKQWESTDRYGSPFRWPQPSRGTERQVWVSQDKTQGEQTTQVP